MESPELTQQLIDQLTQVNTYLGTFTELFKWFLGFVSGLLISQSIAKGYVRHG